MFDAMAKWKRGCLQNIHARVRIPHTLPGSLGQWWTEGLLIPALRVRFLHDSQALVAQLAEAVALKPTTEHPVQTWNVRVRVSPGAQRQSSIAEVQRTHIPQG